MSPTRITEAQAHEIAYNAKYANGPASGVLIEALDSGNVKVTQNPDELHPMSYVLDPNGNEIDLAKQHRDAVLQALADAWAANPEWRLGQLVSNAVVAVNRSSRVPVYAATDEGVVAQLKRLAS